MNLRKISCDLEHRTLSQYASFSDQSKGRQEEEEPCKIRTDYQRDRDRIIHSKAFRRLKRKTQVFIAPEGDHYRTRLTHTLEVAQIARTIARALRLNEDLTEAIALGHDLGHTPFGHAGEEALNSVCPLGFKHYEHSLRLVDKLEKRGNGARGLNLTYEVRDGILNHPTKRMPKTLEGKVVRLADKIAYINHDIDDAIRGGIITEDDLPKDLTDILGKTKSIRLDTLVSDLVITSYQKEDIKMSDEIGQAMMAMRQFMFDNVYVGSIAKIQESKAKRLVKELYNYFYKNKQALPSEYISQIEMGEKPARIICDYVAGMTDQYAISKYNEIFIPSSWQVL